MSGRNGATGSHAASDALRHVSFVVALCASFGLLLFPFVLHGVSGRHVHTGLPAMLLGVAGLLVYGIGYQPDHRVLRILFSPAVAWLLVMMGGLILAS